MPICVKLRQLHVKELCICEYHQKVFTQSERVAVFENEKALIRQLVRWHGQVECWVYRVETVTPDPKAQVEFWEN